MFGRKLKKRIQSLEAQVRGLAKENQQLQASANITKLQNKTLLELVKAYKSKIPVRNEKGQFVKKEVLNGI